MREDRLVQLLTRYLSKKLDADEAHELEQWAKEDLANRQLLSVVSDEASLSRELDIWRRIDPARGYAEWLHRTKARRWTKVLYITGISVAASLLIVVAVNYFGGQAPRMLPAKVATAPVSPIILAGRNTATLTLASGRKILLDSAGVGELGTQGGVRIVKEDSSSLHYMASNGKDEPIAYNELATPRAGQYQLILPDGSKVWLNNLSSIRYPTAFTGKERRVEMTGEGYFEIEHKANQPFIVQMRDADVEVLGTSFNVKSYEEEGGTQTTLLNGAVRVRSRSGTASVRLNPNEQVRVESSGLAVQKGINVKDVISWKEGFFYFSNASLSDVMRQLSRWYDVDVQFPEKIAPVYFEGKIDRGLPLNEVLKFLEKNQIQFQIEGRKLIARPS